MKALMIAALLGAAAAAPGQAAVFQFTLTGDYSASFRIDTAAVPVGTELGLGVNGVSGSFPGSTAGVGDVFFYTAGNGGGFEVLDNADNAVSLIATEGPQLFSGAGASLTFREGTTALTQYLGTGRYSLNIAAVGAAVPETATWAMMIGGFGMVGAAMRRRRTAVRYAA